MKLIDADELDMYEALKSYYGDAWRDAQAVIDEAPTVDAIPVEYILKQIVKLERSKGQSYHAICYRHLLEVWEMGNERKEA